MEGATGRAGDASPRVVTGGSNQDKIIRATGVMWIASAALFLFWYLREYAAAARLGATAQMDAFLVAYSIPIFLAGIMTGLLQTVLIPGYIAAKVESEARLRAYCGEVMTWAALTQVGVTVVIAFAAPWIADNLAPGFEAQQARLVTRLLWLMLPLPTLITLSAVAAAILVAEKRFFASNCLPIISSAVPAALVWFYASRFGVDSFAAGLSIGWAIQCLAGLSLLWFAGVPLTFSARLAPARFGRAVSRALPLFVGIIGTALVPIIDRSMASSFPAGSISALGYADRVLNIGLAFFTSVQTAVFPFFSEQVSRRDFAGLRADVQGTLAFCLFLALPTSVLLVMFGVPLIGMLFGRGAFDAAAVTLTGHVLAAYSLSIGATVVTNVAVRVVNAYRANLIIGILGVINPLIKVVLNLLLWPLGAVGLALSFSGMTIFTTVLLLVAVRVRLGPFVEPWFWTILGKLVLAVALMWLLIVAAREAQEFLGNTRFWQGELVVGVVAFLAACWFLRLQPENWRTLLRGAPNER